MNHPRISHGKTSRRKFLRSAMGVLAGGLLSAPGGAKPPKGQRHNFLVVLSDQETELVPRSLLGIPSRKRLEQHGIYFTQALCAAPQCSPSRASLWTGLFPHQAGVITNVDAGSLGRPLSPQVPTLGTLFRKNGYTTGYLGKWHLGKDDHGLDAFGFSDYRMLDGEDLAEAAAAWIARRTSYPWLLVVSFINPHNIYRAVELMPKLQIREGISLPSNFEDDLHQKPHSQYEFLTHDQGKLTAGWNSSEWLRYKSYYLQLIEKVDANLAVILDAIDRRGEEENTVVVYSSDHGDMGGAHHLPFKGPFMYDELLRVPLVISCPQLFSAPKVCDAMVSTLDLLPTLASIAGVQPLPSLSGRDLSLLFKYPNELLHPAVFAEYYAKQSWVNPIRTIRTKDWKYNLYVAPGREVDEELYNLQSVPLEVHSLSHDARYAQVRSDLRARLLQWRQQTHDPLL